MIVIPGPPVQQGSKDARAYTPKGGGKPRAVVYESAGKKLKRWRSDALVAIRDHIGPVDGPVFDRGVPVALRVRFVFPLRVEDHAAIRRWEKILRLGGWDKLVEAHADRACWPGCPHLPWHTVTPDKDKCTRALFDVLKLGRVWWDDAQCCRFEVLAYRGPEPMTMVEWTPLT